MTRGVGRYSLLLLAAGQSRRFGPGNKLLADVGGEPLLERTVGAFAGLAPFERLAVVAADDVDVGPVLRGRGFRTVANAEIGVAKDQSIRTGLRAIDPEAEGAIILLADMPHVLPSHLEALVAASRLLGMAMTIADDVRSPPLALSRSAIARVLDDQQGAVRDHFATAALVAADGHSLRDYDVPADFAAARAMSGGRP